MGEKDIAFNKCMSNNERYAECFNLAIGRELLLPEKLNRMERVILGETGGKNLSGSKKFYKKENDSIRWYGDQMVCAIFGMEGEANLNYAMVVRSFIYTAYRYNEQLIQLRKQHRRKKDLRGAEYLAGFAETDRLVPVLIVCVYYGKEPWTAPTHLHELLEFKGFTKEEELLLRNLISDYRMLVLDVRHMPIEWIDGMQTDLKHLFQLIRYSENSEELVEYIRNNRETLNNLDEDIFDAAVAIAEMKQLEEIIDKAEGGRKEMCKALDDIISEAEERGRQEMSKALDDIISEAEERGRQEMSKALDDIISEAEERGRQEACKELDGIISEAEERGRQEASKELDNIISEAEERGRQEACKELDGIISEAEERGRQEMSKALDDIISEAEERGRQEACKKLDDRISEAEERGIEEGSRLKAMEVARQLLGILEIEVIAEKTGLSPETVESLR